MLETQLYRLKPYWQEFLLRFNETTNRLKAMAHVGRARFPVRVRQVLKTGELELADTDTTTAHLLRAAGNCLDHACSHDIIGEVVFQGRDGQYYVMTVEATIGEINPEYLKQVRAELEEDEADETRLAAA